MSLECALTAGVNYLARLQHPQGSWTDFWLPVGTADEWATAYVGLALSAAARCSALDRANRDLAADRVVRAILWLLRRHRPLGGWGYNATVPSDADSTAHVLSLLASAQLAPPTEAIAFLRAHEVPGEGFRTYTRRDPNHQWTRPGPDVTAAALRALHDLRAISEAELLTAWQEMLGNAQDVRGWWNGFWWMSPNYTTGLVLEVWSAAGRPPLARPVSQPLPADSAFDLAWAIQARHFCDDHASKSGPRHEERSDDKRSLTSLPNPSDVPSPYRGGQGRGPYYAIGAALERLIALQEPDGGWLSAPILRVPPSHTWAGSQRQPTIAPDARRLFATASAVRALALASALSGWALGDVPLDCLNRWGDACVGLTVTRPLAPNPSVDCAENANDATGQHHGRQQAITSNAAKTERSPLGLALDDLLHEAAQSIGFEPADADEARDVFVALTHESLAAPSPWPTAQLSSLAGGSPLEFSATVGRQVRPALRYAVEVGNPFLAAYERARSGVAAVERTAARLGYGTAWERVRPAVDRLVAPHTPVPDGLRFWVWSGVDAVVQEAGARPLPGLKIYLNLLNYEVGDTRRRIEAALESAAIPLSRELAIVLDLLDDAGFPHELGFGLGPNGRIACKIYYEIDGWHRSLVRRLLEVAGLPTDAEAICPKIPGVLRESLAAKSRAGIALRIDPTSGVVRELTTAAAFPPPLVGHRETGRRVEEWLARAGWHATAYLGLRTLLMPTWDANRDDRVTEGRLHSLFTRTVTTGGAWSSIYLRPFVHGMLEKREPPMNADKRG